MEHEPDEQQSDLKSAPVLAKLALAATPFLLFGLFFLLRHWLTPR